MTAPAIKTPAEADALLARKKNNVISPDQNTTYIKNLENATRTSLTQDFFSIVCFFIGSKLEEPLENFGEVCLNVL